MDINGVHVPVTGPDGALGGGVTAGLLGRRTSDRGGTPGVERRDT
ncbi:hypothetical protein ABZS83_24535 [Streptomyces sp. NPDC005426]